MYDKVLLIACVLLLICSNLFFMIKALDYKRKYEASINFLNQYIGNVNIDDFKFRKLRGQGHIV
jgi:hypothetical protein